MACESEQAAWDAARNHVIGIRQELKDYTGSDKPSNSTPSGIWPEGTSAGNAELADIRARLQDALEVLSAARVALHECLGNAKEDGNVKEEAVNVGVLLEDSKDRDWMRRNLSHDASLDYVIEPRSFKDMLRYFGHLARRGIRIQKLVLMGHGAKMHTHIGRLQPEDVDIDSIRKNSKKYSEICKQLEETIERLKAQLDVTANVETKRKIQEEIEVTKDNLYSQYQTYDENQQQLELLEGASEAFAKDALVGLLSCYAAYDEKARDMMRNLGKVMLERRGGHIVGYSGIIWNPRKIHPVIAYLY